jgi:hypothetical protein
MKNIFNISLIIFAGLFLLSSCQNNNGSDHNAGIKHISKSNSPFIDSLMNALYYNANYGEYIRFSNGQYICDTTYVENSDTIHDVLYMSLGKVIIENDFDKDGKNDALVSLSESGGGSGIFISVTLMLNKNNVPVYVDSKSLGDRIRLDSASIVGDSVFIYSIVQGPNEPMCCPTMPYIFKLVFRNNKLQLLNELY